MLALHAVTIAVALSAAAFGLVSGGLTLAGRPPLLGARRRRIRSEGWAQVLIGVFCLAVATGALLNRSAVAVLTLTPIGLIALAFALRLQVKTLRRR